MKKSRNYRDESKEKHRRWKTHVPEKENKRQSRERHDNKIRSNKYDTLDDGNNKRCEGRVRIEDHMGLDPDDLPIVEDYRSQSDVHNIEVTDMGNQLSDTERKNPHRMFDARVKSKVVQVKNKKSVQFNLNAHDMR